MGDLILDHQPVTFPEGSRVIGPVNIPNFRTRLVLRLARRTTATPTFWADGVNVSLQSDVSFDKGQTWVQWVGFTAPGGIMTGRNGEIPESVVVCQVPSALNRRIRLNVTVTGGTLISEVTTEVS